MATQIGALAAGTTTWILIDQGNVATGHVIRSRKQHSARAEFRRGLCLIPRVYVRGCPWWSVAVDVPTGVDQGLFGRGGNRRCLLPNTTCSPRGGRRDATPVGPCRAGLSRCQPSWRPAGCGRRAPAVGSATATSAGQQSKEPTKRNPRVNPAWAACRLSGSLGSGRQSVTCCRRRYAVGMPRSLSV